MFWRPQRGQKHIQKSITIDDVTKIDNYVAVGFGTRVLTYNVGVNAYFGPRITNCPLPTYNYVTANTKYNMN